MRRSLLALFAMLPLGGCATPPTVPGPQDGTVLTATGPGQATLTLTLEAVDGQTRAVQFLPRARVYADIKSYRFELLDATTGAVRHNLATNTVRPTSYTLTNLAPGTLRVRVTAYSAVDQLGLVLNQGGPTVAGPVTVEDQQVRTLGMTLPLLDGYVANGDLAATVSVTDGLEAALPAPTIE